MTHMPLRAKFAFGILAGLALIVSVVVLSFPHLLISSAIHSTNAEKDEFMDARGEASEKSWGTADITSQILPVTFNDLDKRFLKLKYTKSENDSVVTYFKTHQGMPCKIQYSFNITQDESGMVKTVSRYQQERGCL